MFKKLVESQTEETLFWDDVFQEELKHLGYECSETKGGPNLTGLCLSGGGVRSAIFCGGVVEYLAEQRLLKEFDYLSTVSGGGFTGAALSYWSHSDKDMSSRGTPEAAKLKEEHQATDAAQGAEDADKTAKETATAPFPDYDKYIRHLRANISYLMAGGFKDALIGAYVVLRSILINVLIYIGLTTGLFHFILLQDTGEGGTPGQTGFLSRVWSAFRELIIAHGENYIFLAATVAGLACVVASVLLFPVFSYGTLWKTESGYLWRKRIEQIAAGLLLGTIFLLPFGLLPIAAESIEPIYDALFEFSKDKEDTPMNFGVVGAILGSAISLFGLFRARFGGVFGPFSSATVVLGAILLIISVAVLSMHMAQTWSSPAVGGYVLFSLSLAVFCNVNDVSLGRFYRDRLMEAFMPDKDQVRRAGKKGVPLARQGGTLAREADKLKLSQLKKKVSYSERETPPIHLINANLMSWWASDTRAQRRKGDNFILSCLFCGSDMTHWKRTDAVAKNRLTLATAMSVSGAAVNPQGGFAGQGPTTAWPVAIAMAFLSLRLGYWLRWTEKQVKSTKFGNHIHPGLTQLSKRLLSEVSNRPDKSRLGEPNLYTPEYIELSDGGHFDNLGLYEMIRRECRVMVVCDGGHDPEHSYDAFSVLIRRVSEDFGAKIDFDLEFNKDWARRKGINSEDNPKVKTGPQDLVARPVEDEYPSDTDYADKGYFLARVTYHGTSQKYGYDGYRACRNSKHKTGETRTGLIIYLKSTLIREVDLTTKGYRGSNPLFPSDPTTNQFFSPEQFEAYRDLGRKIAAQMDDELVLDNLMEELKSNDVTKIAAKLHDLDRFA